MNYLRIISVVLLLLNVSCRQISEYFRDPDADPLKETITANLITAFSANLAYSYISGNTFSYVSANRSNSGFPCTVVMTYAVNQASDLPFPVSSANTITIAGLWADEYTGILSILITDYDYGNATLSLLGIQTIPVIVNDGILTLALADNDISLNPDQESILEINLDTQEITSELLRLDAIKPDDVYVAIKQSAYVVEVDLNASLTIFSDDRYSITGGGQLVEVTGNSAEIIQIAMVEVAYSSFCVQNPTEGMALIQTTGTESEGFPELGTALIQFHESCDGQADVMLATGMYLPSNGSSVSFNLLH